MDCMQGLVYTGLCIFYKGVEQAKVSKANEFLDAIQIMIDKASEKQTKIYNGTVTAIGDNNTCSVTVNGKTHRRISYYGKTPTVNQVYRVFVPQNNMSIAFIITEGADIPPSEATDYNDLLNRPQINNVTLSGNKTAKDLGLYGTSNPPSYPVTSVNNKTGNVVLTQDDVGDGTTYVRTHNDFTDALKQQINTNEDNIAMLDTDVDGLQTDVTSLKTNVTNISNALTGKQDSIVGAASTITEDNLTANRAVISNSSGKIAVSDITATELGYLDGAKSNIQKQIDDISGSATSAHYITFTFNSADDTYACDTTFTQIKAWVDAGQEVIGKYVVSAQETYYYKIYELGEDRVKFTSITTPFYLDTKSTVIIDGFNIGWDGIGQTVLRFQFSPTRTVYFTDIANKKLSATYDEMYQWVKNGEQVVLWYNWDSDTPTSDTHAGYWLHLVDSDSGLVFGCVRRAVDRGIWTEQISITNANVVTIVSQQLNNIPSPISKSAAMTQSVGVDSIGGLWTEGSKIDTIQVNGTTQEITNKTVNITVPTTKADIGLGNVDNVKQYSADNPPPYPVTSVNSKTGAVVLGASDVGAVSTEDVTQTLGSSTTKVPSEKAVSDAIGAAGGGDMLKATYDPTGTVATAGGIPDYVTNNSPVKSVDGKTGAVVTEAVKYTTQTLTAAQKTQARNNIGAFNGTSDTLDEHQVSWDTNINANSSGGTLSPVISSLDPILASNKFAFCKPDGITIEYSNDSGSTWTNSGAANSQKVALMTQGRGYGFYIGGKRGAKATVDDQLRITVSAIDCGVRTYLTNILVNISTNGATGCQCKIEYSLYNTADTFSEYKTYSIAGYSDAWNSFPWLPANISNFGTSSATAMAKLRLTFFCTGVTSSANSNLAVTQISLIGTRNWSTNSNLAKAGHIYTYDNDQNVTFPAKVTVNGVGSFMAGVSCNGGGYFANLFLPTGSTNKNITLSGATGDGTFTGTVTANKFVGDGSGLTNLPSSGSSTHIVTVTQNSSGTYTADATFVQIETWINNGEQVVLRHSYNGDGYSYLPLVLYYPNAIATFEGTTVPTTGGADAIIEQITIEYDEAVNRYEFPVLKENKDYTFTVPITGWSNNSVTISVSGVQSSYNTKPIIDLNITPGASNVDALNEAYSKIYAVTTGIDKVTVYATEVPTTAISLTMKVIN